MAHVRRVLDVGQCGPDHAAISQLLKSHFEVEIVRADLMDDAISQLRAGEFHLVLINRKLDADYSDGLLIVRRIVSDPQLSHVPVMLVSNYADAQDEAVSIGARYGFGKAELRNPAVVERLTEILGE